MGIFPFLPLNGIIEVKSSPVADLTVRIHMLFLGFHLSAAQIAGKIAIDGGLQLRFQGLINYEHY
jgi:hypothetical protein